jgi:hypothetical protein
MSAAERQRRRRERLRAERPPAAPDKLAAKLAAAQAEITALKAELAALKGPAAGEPPELPRTAEEWDAMKQRAKEGRSAARKAAKAARPPLPPDEVRDRQIKALKTANQTLRAKLRANEAWYAAERPTVMSFKTVSAISLALHPEHAPTDDERANAIKLFNAWKADARKAR